MNHFEKSSFLLKFSFFVNLSVCYSFLQADKLVTRMAMQGSGEHAYVSLSEWNGKPQLVSRLKKDNKVFLLERVSQTEFLVKEEATNQEIVKLIEQNPWILKPVDGIALVDISIQVNSATVLFSTPNNCIWVRSRPADYVLKAPLHWLPPLSPSTKDWKIESVMYLNPLFENNEALTAGQDPYGLEKLSLNTNADIEFLFKNKTKDIYSFVSLPEKGAETNERFNPICNKNGIPYLIANGAICMNTGILIESVHLNKFKSKNKERVKDFVNFFFNDYKEAINWHRNNFTNKQAAEEIVEIINKAYLSGKE